MHLVDAARQIAWHLVTFSRLARLSSFNPHLTDINSIESVEHTIPPDRSGGAAIRHNKILSI